MSSALNFDPIRLPESCQILRREARAFLAEEIARGTFDPNNPRKSEESASAREFAKRVAAKGWIGMTWPKKYGGRERSFLERYVITEEFRIANAPTRVYFTADRQSGPTIIRYGTETIKNNILPRIVKGEIAFCIGMSEPNSGSDLFAAKTRATKVDGGYLINGTKIWTSNAHQSDYMIGLFRTSPPTKENRRHGLTKFVVDMKTQGHQLQPDPADERPARIQRGGVHRTPSCPTRTCSARSTARGSRRPRNWPMSVPAPSASSKPFTC
jgi:acyl-CoA dehydrogenase